MRVFVACILLLLLLSVTVLPSPVNADLEARVKKLEEEFRFLRQTSEEILKRLETSIFDNFPQTIKSSLNKFYHHFHKESPKWISSVQSFTADLPQHLQTTYSLAHKEGIKHYSTANKLISSQLSQRGVPHQYVPSVTIGIIAVLLLTAVVFTYTILSTIIGAICNCGKKQNRRTTVDAKERNPDHRSRAPKSESEQKQNQPKATKQ